MKSLFVFLLPLAVNGAATHLVERQSGGLTGALAGMALPKRAALKVEQIAPQLGIPGAKRMKLLYGPYKLKAANGTKKVGNGISMDKGGTGWSSMVTDDFPSDITTLATIAELQDEKYQRADTKDGIYNHHVVFIDLSSTQTPGITCEKKTPKSTGPAVYMAGATETGGMRFAATEGNIKSGYYLPKGRKVMNMIDVINYNDVERTVYVSAEIEYLPGKVPGYLDVRQERINPGICGGPDGGNIKPPKGVAKFSVNSTGIIVAREGYIVNARGHVHDGGLDIVFRVNGKDVCDSKASYGGPGHTSTTAEGKVWETISMTSTCSDPIKVMKGDHLDMTANYDLALHPSREQGGGHKMGGMRRSIDDASGPNDGGEAAEQMALLITHFAFV